MGESEFWKDCSAVEINPERLGGRPTVGPYRLGAEDVVAFVEAGETPEQIVENFPGTPLDKVKAILAYYEAHQPQATPHR